MKRYDNLNENYDDIINLPHHVSCRHPKMSMYNRAAQFAPFSALNGHDDAIRETEHLMEIDDLETYSDTEL